MNQKYKQILQDIPSYTRFLTVDEIDYLTTLTIELDNVEHTRIGTTIHNEPLTMISIGSGDKTALICGVPHSDEPLGSLVVSFFARWLATHPQSNWFGWRWHLIPILERRGMQLNEGWFNMPDSFAALAKSNFREPTEDQYEWTFPIEYLDYKWTKSRPEAVAVKKVLQKEKPDLLCNLHHCGFYNAYYYFSRDLPQVYPALRNLASSVQMPLSDSAPDVPFGKMFAPGFYKMYGLKDYLKYYKEKDPSIIPTIKRGACSDEWYQKKIGGFSFNCEVPMYLSSMLSDKKPSEKSYKKLLHQRYIRKKNRVKYSIRLINQIQEYAALANPHLLDIAMKHIANAQHSLDHEKRVSLTAKDKQITNAEVFDNEVMSDLFDLFFLGQIWRVAESICIKGGASSICQLMNHLDIEIKALGKSVQERGGFYQVPIRNSVYMQLGSILYIADVLKQEKNLS
ncbi:MAG: hypothetical protein R6V50_03085 [Thermoplasmatota archaeon]